MKNCEQTKGLSVLEHGISVNNWFYIEDDKIKNLDINHYIKYYGNNSKCVISHKLFLGKNMKSVSNNKSVQSKIEEVLKNQS
jgi:hypothetical protein